MANNPSWKDVNVVILGRKITGIQNVEYKLMQEKEAVMGSGNQPLFLASGAKSYTGKITILQYELDAFVAAVKLANPNNNITDVAFDIVVAYGDGDIAKTDIVQACEITEYQKGMSTTDKFMKIELPFMALGVQENV